ncbi:MAG: type II CAAX prenyl endopeptidase Rce1 family protein [Candidatus Hodarchaeota archaeon]
MKALNEEPMPEDSKRSFIQNKDLLYPFAVVLLILSITDITGSFVAIGFLATLLLGFFGSTSESMMTLLNLLLNLITQIGSILIFITLYHGNRIESEEKKMPPGPFFLIVLLVYSIDFIYIIFVVPIIDTFLEPLGETVITYEGIFPTMDLLGNPLYYILFFGVLVFGAAISEELVFRRALIPFLERRGFGTFWVLMFSSLLFSLIHTPADLIVGSIRYAITHFFGTFAGGLTLGFVYMRTRDVRWPMLLHGMTNGFAGVAAIALARYEELNEYTLIMISGIWMMIFLIVGIGTTVYLVIQFIRKRTSIDVPVWIRILTDFNLRSKYLNSVLTLIISFIIIIGVIPVLLNWIFGYFGETTREIQILENIIGLSYLIPLSIILVYFIYRIAAPLETPDWVSDPIILAEKPIHFIPQQPTANRFCTSCGRQRIQGAQFCVYCGEKYLVYIPREVPEENW